MNYTKLPPLSIMSKTETVYTQAGFEDFLQRYESEGLTRERQEELIAIALSYDITLDQVLLEALYRILRFLRKHFVAVVMVLLVVGAVGYVVHAESQARSGYTDYQPWQFEMSAVLRITQMKVQVTTPRPRFNYRNFSFELSPVNRGKLLLVYCT